MRLTLVLPEEIAIELVRLSNESVENGGFALGRLVQSGDQWRFLVRRYIPVPLEHYEAQKPDEIVVRSGGLVPALGMAADRDDIALWVHTHPGIGNVPVSSPHDKKVDQELAESVRIRTGQPYYGTLIFSPSPEGSGFQFSGTLTSEEHSIRFDRAWVVGDRFALVPAFGMRRGVMPSSYDRHIRAFGEDIQIALGDLQVGVVGCGGTGSAVVEQLARLGVRNFILMDPKRISETNVTRVYGTGPADIDEPKVMLARANVLRIAPSAQVEPIEGDLLSSVGARALTGCDVVFGCTDDDAGRLVLSRLSTYLLCPIIDCGVLISSGPDGRIEGIDGRVTILSPGAACLICRNRIDTQRAAAQFLPPGERAERVAEGYAPALRNVEPSVVTFTSAVAAASVNELLERLIGYGPSPRPTEVLLRFHEREVSTNRAFPRLRHYCHPASEKWGLGISSPFLDLAWPR